MMKPEVQHILVRRPDGFVSVAQFVTKGAGGTQEAPVIVELEATDEAIEAFLVKSGVSWTAWRRIDPTDLPSDDAFRNAWRDSGNVVDVDMTIARDIARDHLRKVRAPVFLDLDVQAARALERADAGRLAEVAADKQRLRDLTGRTEIAGAETAEDLKAAVEQIAAEILNPR